MWILILNLPSNHQPILSPVSTLGIKTVKLAVKICHQLMGAACVNRWFSCCGPCSDTLQCRVPDVETHISQCCSPLGYCGWMQHSICSPSYLNGVLHHRSECQAVPELCPGLQGHWVRPEWLTIGFNFFAGRNGKLAARGRPFCICKIYPNFLRTSSRTFREPQRHD